jgi:MFS family permease
MKIPTVIKDGALPDSVSGLYAIYVVLLLALINIVNFVDRTIFAVLVQPIEAELQLSDTQIGLISGFAFVAVYAAIALPLARLADRIGRRWVLAGSVAVWSLFGAGSGLTQSFSQLAFTRLGVGVGEAGCMPSSHALLAEMYPQGRRAVPISVVSAGAAVGIAMGLSVGGWVAATYGWRWAFIILGLPGILLAILVALTIPEPIRAKPQGMPSATLWETIRSLSKIRTYRWTTFAHPFYTFVTAGVLGWLPAFFARSHDMNVRQVGTFFGLTYGFGIGAGGLLGAYALQKMSARSPARSLFLAGWLAFAAFPFYVAALLVSTTWASLALIMLFGALIGGAGSPMIAGQQGVIQNNMRATASALSMFFGSYLGAGLGPFLIGLGSEMLTPTLGANALRAALLIASGAILLAGLFLVQASRSFAADAKS